MAEKATLRRVRRRAKSKRSPSMRAGQFVREKIRHVKSGKQGPRRRRPSRRRAFAVLGALRQESRRTVSRPALSRFARAVALKRGAAARRQSARKGVMSKGPSMLRMAARKASRARRR
jgi:hypothetical protein